MSEPTERERRQHEYDYLAAANATTMTPEVRADTGRRLRELEALLSDINGAERVTATWLAVTDEQRLELMGMCCHGCGSLDTSCQCWNDE